MTQPPNPYAPPPAAPAAPVYSAPSVQLDPALAAELARMDAAAAARQRGSFEKRSDEWYSPNKPADSGRSAESYILILPATIQHPGALPFVMTAQHHVMLRGEQTSVVCPKRDAQIQDPNGQHGPPPACPLCDASDFCFAQMRLFEKGTAEGDMWKERGKNLSARDRFFANVFDLDNVQSHWKVDQAAGTAGSVAKIWGFGAELSRKLRDIIKDFGMYWHPSSFTRLRLTCARSGPDPRNVKYDLAPTAPFGQAQIPAGYEGALNALVDLNYYRRVRPVAELQAFVPGYARAGGEQQGSVAAPPTVPNPYAGAMAPPPAAHAPPPPPYGAPPAASAGQNGQHVAGYPQTQSGAPLPSYPPPAPPQAQPSYPPPAPPQAQPSYPSPAPPQAQPSYPSPAPPQAPYQPPMPPPMTAAPSGPPPWDAAPPPPPMPAPPPVPSQAAPPVPSQAAPPQASGGLPPLPPPLR